MTALGACGGPRHTSGDVLAAGQPAAILILALAPERLIGWPRRPQASALRLLGGAELPETGALASSGAPAGLEAMAALRPKLILDYGDIDSRYRVLAERAERRTGVPYRLLDGTLAATPEAIRDAGALLGRDSRGRALADRAASLLDRWRRRGRSAPSFYYARGGDGLETGFAGSLATEVLEGAGWANVAVGGRGIGRVPREAVAAWNPELIVTLDAGFARAAHADRVWTERRDGRRRGVLLLPDLPCGWIDRPPSVNRLLGCAWLVGGDALARDTAAWLWRIPPERLAALAVRRLG